MPFIRIPQEHWGTVWWELVSSGPISRISHEPIYAISEKQLRLLRRKKLPFEMISPPKNGPQEKKHAKS